MLFLLKRTWPPALAALAALAGLGLALRDLLGTGAPLGLSAESVLAGVIAFGAVLCSDGLLHGLFCLLFGKPYRTRYRELAAVFRGQTAGAILAGSLMAGAGEEMVFRGLGTGPVYLIGSAVAFGLLHHARRDLWPFTLWAMWQGLLFALALWLTQRLCVPMTAHFLHDVTGFLVFRWVNRQPAAAG
ncbi:MAG TPA: CPBP family intramembrane glutamic endopeptidase [Gemmataceae bacterium]|nr:CPBP family intramembrane glutamic endopeptidase [Gemmataceae bacterium]